MKISDITVGQNYTELKEEIVNSENLRTKVFSIFLMTDYTIVEDTEANEKIYILVDSVDNTIKDITDDIGKITDAKCARDNIDKILNSREEIKE